MTDTSKASKPPRAPACPICKAPTAPDYRPFCSRRCADVDLGRWLSGTYAISGHGDDEESDAPSLPAPSDPMDN
ncbi:MAG: DNA gyrase inhibitor YacG [Hyphomicrobium sp.]